MCFDLSVLLSLLTGGIMGVELAATISPLHWHLLILLASTLWVCNIPLVILILSMLRCTRTAVLVLVRVPGDEQNTCPGLDMRLLIYSVTL